MTEPDEVLLPEPRCWLCDHPSEEPLRYTNRRGYCPECYRESFQATCTSCGELVEIGGLDHKLKECWECAGAREMEERDATK
jgi:hypothetical protein